MPSPCRLMVFTDLDGTLIDHETYDWTPAKPALDALRRVSAGLILASSKTAAEVQQLRNEIGADAWPAIVENGAGVLPGGGGSLPNSDDYASLRSVLIGLPKELRILFQGFGDATAAQVADMTGLSLKDAVMAKQRSFSEPGQWLGSTAQQLAFEAELATNGVTAQQGGRFLTLSFGRNKVDQMRTIIDTYRPQHTIALGDAPNDIAMLENADIGIIVANPARPPLPTLKTEKAGRITRTKQAGPVGWDLAVREAIAGLGL